MSKYISNCVICMKPTEHNRMKHCAKCWNKIYKTISEYTTPYPRDKNGIFDISQHGKEK